MAAAKRSAKKATKKATKKTAKRAAKKTAKKGTRRTAKKATKRTGSSAAAGGSVVVATQVRNSIHSQGARMSSALTDALNAEVNEMLAKAVKRAKDNGRSTVRPSDL